MRDRIICKKYRTQMVPLTPSYAAQSAVNTYQNIWEYEHSIITALIIYIFLHNILLGPEYTWAVYWLNKFVSAWEPKSGVRSYLFLLKSFQIYQIHIKFTQWNYKINLENTTLVPVQPGIQDPTQGIIICTWWLEGSPEHGSEQHIETAPAQDQAPTHYINHLIDIKIKI